MDNLKRAILENNTENAKQIAIECENKRSVLIFLHEYICNIFTKCCIQDISLLNKILCCLENAKNNMTKKNPNAINQFSEQISEIIEIICEYECDNNNFTYEAYEISNIEALVENFGSKRHPELVFLTSEGKISKDLYKILNILYLKLRHEKRSDVIGIIGWLLGHKNITVADLEFEEIEFPKIKNDIVWYLWKIAFLFSKHKLKNNLIDNFLFSNLKLFAFMYKKTQKCRIDIIYFIFYILSKNPIKFIAQDLESKLENDVEVEKNGSSFSYLQFFTPFNAQLSKEVKDEKQLKHNQASTIE